MKSELCLQANLLTCQTFLRIRSIPSPRHLLVSVENFNNKYVNLLLRYGPSYSAQPVAPDMALPASFMSSQQQSYHSAALILHFQKKM